MLTLELSLATAFVTGLLGSTHCIGMCGGIVGALTMGIDPSVRQSRLQMLPYLSAYNVGRIASYVVAGALAGFIGQQFIDATTPDVFVPVGHYVSALFMIALGLYLGHWWMGLTWLEKAGSHVWKRIEPLGRGLLPVRTAGNAALVGLLWGWLPCGMVYAMLSWALMSGGPQQGAFIMLAFGAGTLPMLMAMGSVGAWLSRSTRNPWVRKIAGFVAIAFGIYSLVWGGHAGHGQHAGHDHRSAPVKTLQI